MASVAAESFFRTLPVRLTGDEEHLRRCLHDACDIAYRVLPPHVPLQQWIERRMPGELRLAIDGSGFANLRKELPPPQPMMRPQVAEPNANVEAFFRSLPEDSFTQEEMRLRDALVAAIASMHGKAPAQRVAGDREVKLARAFLPRGVLLEDWVERRIGREVSAGHDKSGHPVFKLGPTSKEQRDAFFEDLPPDSFTPEEMRLRETILDFLDSKRGQVVTLSQVGADKQVGAAKAAFLQHGLPLKEWVERRVASEFSVESSPSGQWIITHIGEQEDLAPEGEEDLPPVEEGSFNDHKDEKTREEEKAAKDAERIAQRENWFKELPDDSLTDAEAALREALLDFIDRWHTVNDAPPTLSNAGSDEAIREGRAACLPRFISLRDWMEHRVGGEIEVAYVENSTEAFFDLRGQMNHAAMQRLIQSQKFKRRSPGEKGKGKGGGKEKSKGDSKGRRRPTPKGNGKEKSGDPKRRRLDPAPNRGSV